MARRNEDGSRLVSVKCRDCGRSFESEDHQDGETGICGRCEYVAIELMQGHRMNDLESDDLDYERDET